MSHTVAKRIAGGADSQLQRTLVHALGGIICTFDATAPYSSHRFVKQWEGTWLPFGADFIDINHKHVHPRGCRRQTSYLNN